MKTLFAGLILILCPFAAYGGPYDVSMSTYLGGALDSDSVKGVRIRSDGQIVVAANIGATQVGGETGLLLNNSTASSGGVVMRLSPDGKTVLAFSRCADAVVDLAIDDANNIWLAAKTGGLIKLNAAADIVEWVRLVGTYVHRVDATGDGRAVCHKPSNLGDPETAAGGGTTYVFNPTGTQTAFFSGMQNTTDICIDGATGTVVQIGWRQANAHDGASTKPVQIAYMRGLNLEGTVLWTNYNWSSTSSDANFINRYTNNMADTRGYRCSIGDDGKLYAAFECAGGNHIFRYSATNLAVSAIVVGGDRWNEFYNTRSDHKTFFARYDTGTGAYLRGQQLCTRKTDGSGNTIRVTGGEIRADASGRVYLGGSAAFGLPIPFGPHYAPRSGETAFTPFPAGTYTGGPFFMVFSPDFTRRLYATRLSPGGSTHAVDGREVGGQPRTVWGGSTNQVHFTADAIQPTSGGLTDGFMAVLANVPDLATFRTANFSQAVLSDPSKKSTVWGDLADPDGDGRGNLIEYYAGTYPNGSEPIPVPDASNPDVLKLRFTKRRNIPDATISILVSEDMVNWSNQGVTITKGVDNGFTHQMEATVPTTGKKRLFLRQVVESP